MVGKFYWKSRDGCMLVEGVVYQIIPVGVYHVLFNFNVRTSGPGADPFAGLVQATDGKFYGATTSAAVLYQITSAGAGTYKNIYTFPPPTGQLPRVSLSQHTNYILYAHPYSTPTR